MKKHRFYISVMGTMGSGKTTAAKLIAERFGFQLLEENFGENAFLPRFYADMKRWAFHSQTFFLMEKTRQLLEVANILNSIQDPHRKTADQVPGIVQDTPIQQDVFSYAKAQHVLGNIDDAEWHLYQKIYHSFEPYFPKPDMIIYLKTNLTIIASRIEHRGRGYEQQIPESYLELLDMLNHKWLGENKTIPVMTINTDNLNIVRSKTAQEEFINLIYQKINNKRKNGNHLSLSSLTG